MSSDLASAEGKSQSFSLFDLECFAVDCALAGSTLGVRKVDADIWVELHPTWLLQIFILLCPSGEQ